MNGRRTALTGTYEKIDEGLICMSKKKFQTKYQRVEKKKAYRQKY